MGDHFFYSSYRAKLLQLTGTVPIHHAGVQLNSKKEETKIIPGKISSKTTLSSHLLQIFQFCINSLITYFVIKAKEKCN